MRDINPEGFLRLADEGCICGPLYTYGGCVEPGQFDPHCPYHYPEWNDGQPE